MLNPTRKLTHTRYLGDRGKNTARETRSGFEIAGFEATGSHFGLNLHTAVAASAHVSDNGSWQEGGGKTQTL